MTDDIELPWHFASPVLAGLMETNHGKEHFANAVRGETGRLLPQRGAREVIDFNYQRAREAEPRLSGSYEYWTDTIAMDGYTYHLAGWYEAV